MLGIPLNEMVLLAAAIVAGGVVAGLLAGLFGVGGGVVAVPVLYEVFRVLGVPDAVHMQLCIGTSLAIMAPTNIRYYLTHRATGASTSCSRKASCTTRTPRATRCSRGSVIA